MNLSKAGLELIKAHEGLRLTAYPDPGTGGEPWTIGYGTTSRAGVGKVTKGMKITQAEAEELLRRGLAVFELGVKNALTRMPTQNQYDALVSFTYNVGLPNLRKSSVLRFFNEGNIQAAGDALLKWNKAAGKVMPGLVKRREAERALFLKPSAPVASAPPVQSPKPVPPNDEPVLRPPADTPPPETKPGPSIAGWILGALAFAIAAAAAYIVKGN